MRVKLPYLVQDQLTAAKKGMRPIESFHYDGDEIFLDGPVSRRVAILDFDEDNGELLEPIKFHPPTAHRKLGRYDIPSHPSPSNRNFQRVSVFSTILKTIRAFEREDVLGRELTWAFDGPQLLVIPRAGKWANAFYERESRSLQFFHFESESQPGREIFTSLSHDIVTHEAGHAILDGIAPSLYDAITPQALALHEAIADLTSLVMSLESGVLRRTVLDQMNGRIDAPTAISRVAEEFGCALGEGKLHLRSLWNEKTLNPSDRSRDEHGEPNLVSRSSPHDLSQVASGALYRLLVRLHEMQIDRLTEGIDDPEELKRQRFSRSGEALAVAAKIFRRIVMRSLDYLPPGEISFADFGRAIISADWSSNPDEPEYRNLIAEEFVRRHIAASTDELLNKPSIRGRKIEDVDPDTLLESDWAAYQFVEANRPILGIPDTTPFRILPRLAVEKTTWQREDGHSSYRELILKVEWERQELNDVTSLGADTRAISVGLTLAINRDDKTVNALLNTSDDDAQRLDRSRFLQQLIDDELLSVGPHSADVSSGIDVQVSGDVLRIKGASRSLHLNAEVA